MFDDFRLFIGLGRGSTSAKEKMVAGVTGLFGIGLIYLAGKSVGDYAAVFSDSFMLIPIAATAVLLFSVPHGALSQPWPVIGGNVSSALAGMFCSENIDSVWLAASVSVGSAIFLMNYSKCIHPPGGAAALSAVLGGEAIQSLDYYFVIFPVLFSAVGMVILAILLNFPFKWRTYPAHLFHLRNALPRMEPSQRKSEITLEDFIAAVNQHDSYIDMTEDSWIELFELAKLNAEKGVDHPADIKVSAFYSNGQLGKAWAVRKVLSRIEKRRGKSVTVLFETVAGQGVNETARCSLEDFRAWARFEVVKKNDFWEKYPG